MQTELHHQHVSEHHHSCLDPHHKLPPQRPQHHEVCQDCGQLITTDIIDENHHSRMKDKNKEESIGMKTTIKVSPTTTDVNANMDATEVSDSSLMSSTFINSSTESEAGPSNQHDDNIMINPRIHDIDSVPEDDDEDQLQSFIPETVEIAVRVKKLNLSYKEKLLNSLTNASSASPVFVLNGLSLTVPSGSIYGLLGPSGCGKTSLLRCM